MPASRKSDLIDLTMHLHAETAAAIKASDDGDSAHAKWLPKSQIEFELIRGGPSIEVTMPEWLAIEKGLV